MTSQGHEVGMLWRGEYLLQATLGDPAHGVYRAQRKRDGQTCVVRIWRAPSEQQAEEFLALARAACTLRHPALAQVEATGRDGDSCFVVSEYLVGQKLDTWADQVGIPPLRQVVDLTLRLCEGLQHAASSGVTHSGLHPRNVVVLHADPPSERRPAPKLLDLGVPTSARARPPHTLAAQFMAPEQLAAALDPALPLPAITPAMNVYSCGALIYYLCTGGPPFRRDDLAGLREAQQNARLTLPSRINPQITPSLNAVIVQALALDPKLRFPAVAQLAEALAHVNLTQSNAGARPSIPSGRRSSVPMPPPAARRPPPAPAEFEPESETARTGRLTAGSLPPLTNQSTLPPPPDFDERQSVPAGSFSSAPPPARVSPPPPQPQAVLATPLSLFSGSPSAAGMKVEPALIVTRVDGGSSQLLGPHDMLGARPPRRRALPPTAVMYSALALVVALGTYGVVRLFGLAESAPPAATPRVTRDPTSAEPVAALPAPARRPVQVAPPTVIEPASSAVEPADSRARDNGDPRAIARAPRSSRSSSRSVTGAVSASHDVRSSNPPEPAPGPEHHEPAAAAAPRAPEPQNGSASKQSEPAAEDKRIPPGPVEEGSIAKSPPKPEPLAQTPPPVAPAAKPDSTASPVEAAGAPRPAGPQKREANTAIAGISVRGPLPNSVVRRSVERVRGQFKSCYDRAAQAAGDNRFGTVEVEVDIDERGRARNARARGGALPGLNDCVAEAAGKVISEPPDTGTVHATFKVIFSP